jgi:tetratricopeptide (TPR) repeat protein
MGGEILMDKNDELKMFQEEDADQPETNCDIDQQTIAIQSVDDIHNRLSAFSGDKNTISEFAGKLYNALVSYKDRILGMDSDYHNLSVEFAKRECPQYALGTAKLGAQRFPFSTTLLADIILYGQKVCAFDDCEKAFNRLHQIPHAYWEWRSFVFAIDYLKDSLSWVQSIEIYEKNRSNAFELIKVFKETIPFDERAYVAEAEMYTLVSDIEKAISVLETAIKKVEVAPQCCLKLADLYLDLGKYEDVLKTAAIGIRATTQGQPTASIPYFFYVSALARDALLHIEATRNYPSTKNGFMDNSAVTDALTDYNIASELFLIQRRFEYSQTIKMRSRILEIKSGLSLAESNSKTGNDTAESIEDKLKMLKLLSSLVEDKS